MSESINDSIRLAAKRSRVGEPEPKPKREIDPEAIADRIDSALLALRDLGDELKELRFQVLPEDEDELDELDGGGVDSSRRR